MNATYPNHPVHSYHFFTTNRDFVIDSITRCIKPYGYFPIPKGEDFEVPPGSARHRFYISAVHKGWISVTDNQYFARWELARRSSTYIPGRVVVLWGDPGEGWGYQYWDQGSLQAELVSDMMELHREWFDQEPTDDEVRRFDGNPERMKEAFGTHGFSLREMRDVYALPPAESMRALQEFGKQIALEDGLMNFPAIDALPITERLGNMGIHHVDFYQRYRVDLDDPTLPDEVVFPEDPAPDAQA